MIIIEGERDNRAYLEDSGLHCVLHYLIRTNEMRRFGIGESLGVRIDSQ